MRTNIQLIQLFSDSNILRQYTVYLKLKHLFENGCIYKYNVHKFAQISGLSRNSIAKYVKFFLENGWCKMHNNNLCFISLSLLKDRYQVKQIDNIIIPNKGNIQTLLNNLRYQLLKQKQIQFNFLKKMSQDRYNPTGFNKTLKLKKATRFFKKSNVKPLIGETELKISLKKLGCIINLSPSTAHNIIKEKVKQRKAKIIKTPFYRTTGTLHNLPPNTFNSNGSIYLANCNKYVFN